MGEKAHKWKRRTGRTLLWLGAIVFVLLILSQLAVWAGILWLSSKDGQGWLEARLQEATAASEYEVTIDGLHYRLLTGIKADILKISDKDGPVFEAKNTQAHLEIYPLPTRTLLLSMTIDEATLHRLPERKGNSEKEKAILEPLELPDIYFRTLSLSKFSIKKLNLPQGLTLSPTLRGRVMLKERSLSGRLFLGIDKIETRQTVIADLLPRESKFFATLNTKSPALNIEKIDLLAPAYSLSGKGNIKLDETKTVDLSAALISEHLDRINPALAGKLNTALTLGGKIDRLNATAKAILDLKKLKENDISPLVLDLDAQNLTSTLSGEISIDATQNKAPLGFNARFSKEGEIFYLKDMTGTGPNIAFSGNLSSGPARIEARIHQAKLQTFQLEGTSLKITNIENTASRKVLAKGSGRLDAPFSFEASADVIDDKVKNIIARIQAGKSAIALNGMLDTQNIDLTAMTKFFRLSAFPVTLPEPFPSLILDGEAHISGPLQSPELQSTVSLAARNVKLTGTGSYQNNTAHLTLKGTGQGIKNLSGELTAPLMFSLSPFKFDAGTQTPLEGDFSGKFETRGIAAAFLPPAHAIEGQVKTNGTFSGTLGKPDITADLSLENARYEHKNLGLVLQNIDMNAAMQNNILHLKSLTARDEKDGTLTASGTVTFGTPDFKTDLKLTGNNIHALNSERLNGIVSADLAFKGQKSDYRLSGTLSAQQLSITLPERFGQSIPSLNVFTPQEQKKNESDIMQNIALDLIADAPKKVFVRGWGLDAEFGGKLKITGNAKTPLYEGQFDILRGRYSEFGKRFNITKANMIFSGPVPPSPALDITAETKADDITAQVNITGTPEKPQIGFSSVPALPEDEVLSRILFGRDMSKITPFQAVQLTQTLQRFSGNGGGASFDALGMLRKGTALDDLRVETDENGGASVGAGKYLSDNVYLDFSSSTEEDSGSATIEIEVTPNITVESEIGQDAQGGAGVFWKWDY